MNKSRFVEQLKATAKELAPLSQSARASSLMWNGTEYVRAGETRTPDPYALSWQTMLIAIAELLDAQEGPLTGKQAEYLERLLFGGMGSLNDLFFDPKVGGDTAKTVNDRLDKRRRALFASFKDG
jgi:hypothetical protein